MLNSFLTTYLKQIIQITRFIQDVREEPLQLDTFATNFIWIQFFVINSPKILKNSFGFFTSAIIFCGANGTNSILQLALRPHTVLPRPRSCSHPGSASGLAHPSPPLHGHHSVKPYTNHIRHVEGVVPRKGLTVELMESTVIVNSLLNQLHLHFQYVIDFYQHAPLTAGPAFSNIQPISFKPRPHPSSLHSPISLSQTLY